MVAKRAEDTLVCPQSLQEHQQGSQEPSTPSALGKEGKGQEQDLGRLAPTGMSFSLK